MRFHLQRYSRALRSHKKWWFAALVPLVFYLIYAALDDIDYTVSRDFAYFSGDIPVAAPNSPIGTINLSELVVDPDLLFLDGFALNRLHKKLDLLESSYGLTDDTELRRLVHSALSLVEIDGFRLRLSYNGKDEKLASILVAFYSDRLMKRIADGIARLKSSPLQMPRMLQPEGDIVVVGKRSLWNAERLAPALAVLLASSLGTMILIAIFELLDPSFKSERQIARYLELPVLGTIPDAEPLAKNFPA